MIKLNIEIFDYAIKQKQFGNEKSTIHFKSIKCES